MQFERIYVYETKKMSNISWKKVGIAVAVGGGVALVGAPLAVSAIGFKASGIAAGSLAAKMMSATAVANGGAVIGGSTVSLLQSAGVLGLAAKTTAVVGSTAGGISALVTGVKKDT